MIKNILVLVSFAGFAFADPTPGAVTPPAEKVEKQLEANKGKKVEKKKEEKKKEEQKPNS